MTLVVFQIYFKLLYHSSYSLGRINQSNYVYSVGVEQVQSKHRRFITERLVKAITRVSLTCKGCQVLALGTTD